MDRTVPAPAAYLLDNFGKIEAPQGYDTIYGNNQWKLKRKPTQMTLDEVIAAGPAWTKAYGSSACGRYQFMRATLIGLKKELKLTGREVFSADLQDRLAYHLLKRRGYIRWINGTLNDVGFALNIAKEWASFPVLAPVKGAHRWLKRGQSYYIGDALNKALIKPEKVEAILLEAKTLRIDIPGTTAEDDPYVEPKTTSLTKKVAVGTGIGATCATGAAAVVEGTGNTQTVLEQVQPVTDTISLIGTYGPWIAGGVVGIIALAFVSIALYKWARS